MLVPPSSRLKRKAISFSSPPHISQERVRSPVPIQKGNNIFFGHGDERFPLLPVVGLSLFRIVDNRGFFSFFTLLWSALGTFAKFKDLRFFFAILAQKEIDSFLLPLEANSVENFFFCFPPPKKKWVSPPFPRPKRDGFSFSISLSFPPGKSERIGLGTFFPFL